MDLRHLGAMVLLLLVAAIVTTIGSAILTGIAEQACEDDDGIWNASTAHCGISNNETTNNITGYDYNISLEGLESMETVGDWLPLIALVVAASIVIGVIVGYLGRT